MTAALVPMHAGITVNGPFAMTSEAEIAQAIRDFQAGRVGAL